MAHVATLQATRDALAASVGGKEFQIVSVVVSFDFVVFFSRYRWFRKGVTIVHRDAQRAQRTRNWCHKRMLFVFCWNFDNMFVIDLYSRRRLWVRQSTRSNANVVLVRRHQACYSKNWILCVFCFVCEVDDDEDVTKATREEVKQVSLASSSQPIFRFVGRNVVCRTIRLFRQTWSMGKSNDDFVSTKQFAFFK